MRRSELATVDTITVADDPASWRAVGFDVDDRGRCAVGTVDLLLTGTGERRGIARWSVRGLASTDLDGLPTERSDAPEREPAPVHPNGVRRIDHVVAFTPDRSRTAAALEAAGLDLRRLRDEPTPAGGGHQAFFRLGEVILEVIEYGAGSDRPADAPARLWGLAFGVDSLDATTGLIGERVSEPRDAVQEGRRIATLRRSAGVGVAVAFMS